MVQLAVRPMITTAAALPVMYVLGRLVKMNSTIMQADSAQPAKRPERRPEFSHRNLLKRRLTSMPVVMALSGQYWLSCKSSMKYASEFCEFIKLNPGPFATSIAALYRPNAIE